jgi:hypothetical protein
MMALPKKIAGMPVHLTDADMGISFKEAAAELIANLHLSAESIAQAIELALEDGPIERRRLLDDFGRTFDSVAINTVILLMQRSGRIAIVGPRLFAPHHATGAFVGRDNYVVAVFEGTADHFTSVFGDLARSYKGVVPRTALLAIMPSTSVDRWAAAQIEEGLIAKVPLGKGRVGYRYKK